MSLTRSARGKGAGQYGLRPGRSLGADQAVPKSIASQGPVAAAKWKSDQAAAAGRTGSSGQDAFEKAAAHMVQKIKDDKAGKPASAAPAPTAKPAKSITPKRQAAMDAYTKTFERPPTKSMTISAMDAAVKRAAYLKNARENLRRQTPSYQGPAPQKPADPAGAFQQKFGHPPPDGMSKGGMTRWTESSMTKAPAPPGAYGPVGSLADRLGSGDAHKVAASRTPSAVTPRAEPAPTGPPGSTWNRVNTGLAVYGAGVQIANAYNRARDEGKSSGDAAIEAAKAGAAPAAILAANPISKGAGHVATGAFALSRGLMEMTGAVDMIFMNMAAAKAAVVTGAVGVAAKGVELGAKIIGKVAAPAVAAYGAYQGAKEDTANPMRGAARGAIRGLDPTSIFMAKGLGERAFDGAFGSVNPASNPAMGGKRLTSQQSQSFAAANSKFGGSAQPASTPREPGKGREYAGEFIDVTNANGTTFKRRNPDYGTAGEKR